MGKRSITPDRRTPTQVTAARRAPAPAPPSRGSSRVPMVVGIVVVALLALVVGGVVLTQGGEDPQTTQSAAPAGAIPLARAAAQYPTAVQDAVVVAGGPADHVLDVYEDALCPACGQLEQRAGARFAQAVAAGDVQIRYHLLPMLDRLSQPAGYSGLAGNAMVCAAEHGAFPDVHTSLYAAQPAENAPAWSTDQLVDLGQRAGAGPGYADCVRAATHAAGLTGNLQRAATDDALVREGARGFGTPTVVLDDELVQGDDTRLDDVLGG